MFFPRFDESATGGTTGSAPTDSSPSDSQAASAPSSTQTASGASDATALAGGQPDDGQSTLTPSAPAAPTLFDRFRSEYGIDFAHKYRDENQLLRGLVEAQKLVGQRNQDAEIGRLYGQYVNDFQEFLAQRQAKASGQQPPPTEKKSLWEPPEWRQGWTAYLDAETGMPIETAPMEVRTAFEKRRQFYDTHRDNLVYNFPQAIQPYLDQMRQQVLSDVQQQYAASQAQLQRSHEANAIVAQHSNWIYQNDGQRILTDEFGRKLLTPAGQIMLNNVVAIEEAGIVKNQQLAFELAALKTQQQLGLLQAEQPAAAPTNQIPNTAVRSPNSNRGRAPNGQFVKGNEGLSLREMILRDTAHLKDEDFALKSA